MFIASENTLELVSLVSCAETLTDSTKSLVAVKL